MKIWDNSRFEGQNPSKFLPSKHQEAMGDDIVDYMGHCSLAFCSIMNKCPESEITTNAKRASYRGCALQTALHLAPFHLTAQDCDRVPRWNAFWPHRVQ